MSIPPSGAVVLTGQETLPPALARAGVRLVHEEALDEPLLASLRALLVSQHADQEALAACTAGLEALLERGGTILFCGQVARSFLPQLRPFEPLGQPTLAALEVSFHTFHPLFAGVDARDLTYRRGVAGFFGRGADPPPEGARVIATIDRGRVPLDWELVLPGGGRLYVHAGNDLWSFALDESDTSARLVPNLLAWLGLAPSGEGA